MKTMVIKTTGECEEHSHAFVLEEVQAACGGWVNSIRLDNGMQMWVNGVGLVQSGFKPNMLATIVVMTGGYFPSHVLMGDVVLMGDDGEEFPEGIVRAIKYIKQQYNAKLERTN